VGSLLSNNQYLYQDLFIVFVLAITLGGTPATRTLTRKRPSGQLLSAYNLTVCFGFMALTFAAQGVVYGAVAAQPWYAAYPKVMEDDPEGTNAAVPVTTSLFLVASYQYLAVAIIFSLGGPWKRPTWTNRPFCAWLAVVMVVSTAIALVQDPALYRFVGLAVLPPAWHAALLGYAALSLVLYTGFIAGAWAARRAGLFTALGAAVGLRRMVKPHKRLRAEWAVRMGALGSAAVAVGEGGVKPVAVEAAGRRHDAVALASVGGAGAGGGTQYAYEYADAGKVAVPMEGATVTLLSPLAGKPSAVPAAPVGVGGWA
jgi:hypothetical protein